MKKNHLEKLYTLLSPNMDAVLLTGEANRRYVTGAAIDEGICLVSAFGCRYFTDGRYLETARQQLPDLEVLEIDRDHSYYDRIREAIADWGLHALGIEEEKLTCGAAQRLREKTGLSLLPCQSALDGLRAVKEPWEQELMRRAQQITDSVFTDILDVIHPGMSEKELEAELIYRLYRAGAEGLSFPPIVVSGPNTSMPHGVAGQRKLQNGDFITMDFGIRLEGYCSDMTRTVALGSVSPQMREVYQTVLRAQMAGIAAVRAGRSGREIDAFARNVISDAGWGQYFSHSFGHSLGLEIHETPNFSPTCTDPIPAGATVSAEPGIYFPGEFGVRIEDVVIVGDLACENITVSTKELIIL